MCSHRGAVVVEAGQRHITPASPVRIMRGTTTQPAAIWSVFSIGRRSVRSMSTVMASRLCRASSARASSSSSSNPAVRWTSTPTCVGMTQCSTTSASPMRGSSVRKRRTGRTGRWPTTAISTSTTCRSCTRTHSGPTTPTPRSMTPGDPTSGSHHPTIACSPSANSTKPTGATATSRAACGPSSPTSRSPGSTFCWTASRGGGRMYMISTLYPGATPDTSVTYQNFLATFEPTEEFAAAIAAQREFLLGVVVDEDYFTGNRIQRALKTNAKPNVIFGRNEAGGQRFHGWVDQLIAAEDDEGVRRALRERRHRIPALTAAERPARQVMTGRMVPPCLDWTRSSPSKTELLIPGVSAPPTRGTDRFRVRHHARRSGGRNWPVFAEMPPSALITGAGHRCRFGAHEESEHGRHLVGLSPTAGGRCADVALRRPPASPAGRSVIPVIVGPGQTTLTLMSSAPRSSAAERARLRTAAFDALYAHMGRVPTLPRRRCGDRNRPAAPDAHGRRGRTDPTSDRAHVDIDRSVEVLHRERLDGPAHRDAGIEYDGVEPAERLDGQADEGIVRIGRGDIGRSPARCDRCHCTTPGARRSDRQPPLTRPRARAARRPIARYRSPPR